MALDLKSISELYEKDEDDDASLVMHALLDVLRKTRKVTQELLDIDNDGFKAPEQRMAAMYPVLDRLRAALAMAKEGGGDAEEDE